MASQLPRSMDTHSEDGAKLLAAAAERCAGGEARCLPGGAARGGPAGASTSWGPPTAPALT